MTSDASELTDAGWPRPRHGGYPIPWVSPPNDLSEMNKGRYQACASGSLCPVCGLGYLVGDTAYALVHKTAGQTAADFPVTSTSAVAPMDNAVMHEQCYRLAVASCPRLRALLVADELLAVHVEANDGDVEVDDEPDAAARCVIPAGSWWHLGEQQPDRTADDLESGT